MIGDGYGVSEASHSALVFIVAIGRTHWCSGWGGPIWTTILELAIPLPPRLDHHKLLIGPWKLVGGGKWKWEVELGSGGFPRLRHWKCNAAWSQQYGLGALHAARIDSNGQSPAIPPFPAGLSYAACVCGLWKKSSRLSALPAAIWHMIQAMASSGCRINLWLPFPGAGSTYGCMVAFCRSKQSNADDVLRNLCIQIRRKRFVVPMIRGT